MNAITRTTPPQSLPAPRVAVEVRAATADDLPFIDELHKKNRNGLGFFSMQHFEGYLKMGAILIAESVASASRRCSEGMGETPMRRERLGYVISRDRYLKRDELGVIYQLCVVQGEQRKLVGATLIQEVFKRSAYGCRLYCLWCAKDLAANHFWESLGFVPVAFRAGSDKRKRVHIFWQKRIVENDVTTPYWYPSATNGGSIRADRLVFPIPPGTHWQEVEAVAVPIEAAATEQAQLPEATAEKNRPRRKKADAPVAKEARKPMVMGGFRYATAAPAPVEKPAKPAKPKKKPAKIDPKFLATNRELRDRYLEQLNTLDVVGQGKYDVSRALPSRAGMPVPLPAPKSPAPLLEAA